MATSKPPAIDADAAAARRVDAVEAWHALAIGLRHPDIELTTETFGDVWTAYQRRRAAGPVDPMLVTLLGMLSRQVLRLDDGVEDDDEFEHAIADAYAGPAVIVTATPAVIVTTAGPIHIGNDIGAEVRS